MRPVIGLSSNFKLDPEPPHSPQICLSAAYLDAVSAAGGVPQMLYVPESFDDGMLDELLSHVDGLVLTGGFDIHPRHYGQTPHPASTVLPPRRDNLEIALARRADAAGLPILAICLGIQVMHVARGGKLIQHVDDLPQVTPVTHHLPDDTNAYHMVRVTPGSRLHQILGADEVEVNSRHHQIVDPDVPARGLVPVAFAPDGVLEGAEDPERPFLVCVQWHPENLINRPEHLRLFQAHVTAADEWRQSGRRQSAAVG